MKHLKKIFENTLPPDFVLSKETLKILSDFGISGDEYAKMISIFDTRNYFFIKNSMPFYDEMSRRNNFNISSCEEMRMMISAYKLCVSDIDKTEEIEDYFLEIMDDKSFGVDVNFSSVTNSAIFTIKYTNLLDISEKLNLIHKKFERSRHKYTIGGVNAITRDGERMIELTIKI